MKELILHEYGRNIQKMVEIAMTIPDRNERNRCARSIINCMGNLFPYLRDNEAFAMTDECYMLERYKASDPWFTPWMPNASASGRTILMMLDMAEKENNE